MKYIFFLLFFFFFSCSEPPERVGEGTKKELMKKRQGFEKNLQEASHGHTPEEHKKSKHKSATKQNSLEDIFDYKVPSHWTRQASTPFRLFNFSFGQTGEAYLNFSKGSSGGLLANINRWRQQVGLEKINQDDIIKKTKVVNLFNRPASYVDLSGDYQSMQGGVKKGWRVLGVISVNPQFSFFLKMTGKEGEVAKEKANFEAFCHSFAIKREQKQQASSQSNNINGHNGLDLHFPRTWEVDKKQGGIVYLSAKKGQAKLTVTKLSGLGGGIQGNYQRWCKQFGLEKIPNYENFDKIKILGKPYSMINISGSYRGMGQAVQIKNATLLGFIIPTEEETIFIKLIVPKEFVNTAFIDEFKAIAKTLHL